MFPFLERISGGRAEFAERTLSLPAFLEGEILTDGGPFTFEGREPLREVVAHLDEILRLGLPERTVSVLKGTQIGMTTIAVGLALYCAAVRRLNVGYFLPDQDFANRFDDTRVRPAIRSRRLARSLRDGAYKGASPKGLKEFPGRDGSRFLYILGLRDMGNAISLPLDVLIRDEVDDLPPENLKWSNDRLDASRLGLTVNLAMGRTPGQGIHEMYERGERRVWRVGCAACGRETVLEEEWPGILRAEGAEEEEKGKKGRLLACPGCGGSLARSAGRWAPQSPGAGARSYRVSQLAVGAIRLERIAAKWEEARGPGDQAKFRCSCLGMPDAGEMQPVGAGLLRRLREAAPYAMAFVPSSGRGEEAEEAGGLRAAAARAGSAPQAGSAG
ncbi:MAG: phage terminase large subunit family protein [bacterium]